MITNRGKEIKSGHRLQIRARGISNRDRDCKFGQGLQIGAEYHSIMKYFIAINVFFNNFCIIIKGPTWKVIFLQCLIICKFIINFVMVNSFEKFNQTLYIKKILDILQWNIFTLGNINPHRITKTSLLIGIFPGCNLTKLGNKNLQYHEIYHGPFEKLFHH